MRSEGCNLTYLVLGSKPWSRKVFDEKISKYSGQWHFLHSREQLTSNVVRALDPRYLFFLHWSWKVPDEIVESYDCVCFHMTDLPYGRGGSPLQNLIIRGHQRTKLSALRMTPDFDAGPVYLKQDLGLEGSAEEIYLRANYLAAEMIETIIREQPQPLDQTGEVVIFKRRKPEESKIPEAVSLSGLLDFIRMLDAEGYPKAFIDFNGFRYEFRRASLKDGRIVADVVITPIEESAS
jgi:methionyl-tRNA formyltransferase